MSVMDPQEREARSRFKKEAKEQGFCDAFEVFRFGNHGEVYVGCGLKPDHGHPFHQTQQGPEPNGKVAIFRWPVEE